MAEFLSRYEFFSSFRVWVRAFVQSPWYFFMAVSQVSSTDEPMVSEDMINTAKKAADPKRVSEKIIFFIFCSLIILYQGG